MRGRILSWVVLGLAGAAFVFLFSYRFVLNRFMVGPHLWDTGWLSNAIFQKGFVLPNPPYLRQALGESLFTQHVYGLVSLASPVSYLFKTHYEYFAAVIGATYMLAFLGPFLAVMALRGPRDRSVALSAVASAAGLAFAFSGPVVSAMGYPHFETAIPSLFIVFVALHFLGWPRAKWVALCLGLIVREDAGLHYLGYFALIAFHQWRSGREPMPRGTLLRAAALSVVVSAAMLVGQKQFFPLGASMFYKSFVGTPAWAHVTDAELRTRVSTFLLSARHLYAPMVVIGAAALFFRAPVYALAYTACIPWIVLNLAFSLTPAARTLSLYYGFPLLVGLVWPLLAPHWMTDASRSRAKQWALPTFFAASAISLAFLQGHAFVGASAAAGGEIPLSTFTREGRCLETAFREEPKLYADTAVLAMFPQSVPVTRVLRTSADVAVIDAQAFVFYENEMAPAYQQRARELGLTYATTLTVPQIRVLSRDPSVFAACLGLGASGR